MAIKFSDLIENINVNYPVVDAGNGHVKGVIFADLGEPLSGENISSIPATKRGLNSIVVPELKEGLNEIQSFILSQQENSTELEKQAFIEQSKIVSQAEVENTILKNYYRKALLNAIRGILINPSTKTSSQHLYSINSFTILLHPTQLIILNKFLTI